MFALWISLGLSLLQEPAARKIEIGQPVEVWLESEAPDGEFAVAYDASMSGCDPFRFLAEATGTYRLNGIPRNDTGEFQVYLGAVSAPRNG
ncbi:MAG: hypothetical protein ACPG31_05825 [Planctomycetota bacterium]